MINRRKTITALIAVAMCTSLLNTSIIPAVETNTNENTQVNANSSEEDKLDNSTIVANTSTSAEAGTSNELDKEDTSNSTNSENVSTSTTVGAVIVSTDTQMSLITNTPVSSLSDATVPSSINAQISSDYVTIQQTENGTIALDESLSDETTGYLKYIIKPNDGYEIKDLIVDGQSVGIHTYYEFKNLTESGHTISAVFKEIEKHGTGYIPEFVEIPYVYKPDANNNLPSEFGLDSATFEDQSYNTTTKEYISSVKNQGQLDTCWTFSSLGVFESSLLKENKITSQDTYDFSENHMRYALSSDGGNNLGFDRRNYAAGNFDMALAYLTRGQMNGVVNESDDKYPADTTSSEAKATRVLTDFSGQKVEDYYPSQVIRLGDLPLNATTDQKDTRRDQIKNIIMSYGAVTLSYYSDNSYYNIAADHSKASYYNPNVPTRSDTNYPQSNHGVSIVGWDDNYSKSNFKAGFQPDHDGAFLVKNSWGTSWGQNGYFYISYDDVNSCTGINAFKEIKSRDFFNNMYE